MKRCPQCKTFYKDETLNFCLEDGIVLINVESTSTKENITRPTEQQTEILPNELVLTALKTEEYSPKITDDKFIETETVVRNVPVTAASRSGVSPVFAYLTVGLLTVLVVFAGVALFVWLNDNPAKNEIAQDLTNSKAKEANENIAGSELNEANLNLAKIETPNPKPTGEPKTAATPKKTEESEKVSPPTPSETPNTTPTTEKPSGKYFVVIGSFPPSQSAQAQQRLQKAQSKGLNARIINTSNFPGLKGGLLAVVAGPFSKAEAQNALSSAKGVSGDSYIKAGF